MDIYGTAVTAVQQVIQVTIFIKGVISDIKSYDDDRAAIQLRLDLQLTSLEFFQRRFLDKQRGLLLPGQLPNWVGETICNLLLKMGRVLVDYRLLVKEYEILDASPLTLNDEEPAEKEKWKQSFLERAKGKAKALKLKGYDWALFDKKKLLGVLAEYKEWTDSLRDLMQHFSQEALYTLTDHPAPSPSAGDSLKGTGLEPVVKRQQLAFVNAPDDFRELQGDIVEGDRASDRFYLGSWTHQGESTPVVLEFREYDRRLRYDDLEPDEIAELKAPLRNLAWLLQNATFSEGKPVAEEESQPTIYSLQCLGYQDQAEKERTVFVYRLPAQNVVDHIPEGVQRLTTLHDVINLVDPQTKRPTKPSLEDRFAMAHCLALTTLNVHGSLWVHKNIWSRGILVFEQAEGGTIGLWSGPTLATSVSPGADRARRPRLLAFLGDWGYARPVEGATDMRSDFEIEPNLYRHPDRQGVPTRQFSRLHDMYALGVVLLEIGLWKTVSRLFESRIKEGQRTGKLPKPRDVRAALTSLAQRDLPKEMGGAYAEAVVACLSGNFRKASEVELSLDFREKVVDTVAGGLQL
ncbi:uncharacterized protein BO80DRAFT_426275 [Aspergillus ibericus CBS 121593]|uniref:Protein kinase domain-containing protein n=1 Tax=Aspergillus ibericus CBS 121593 TaxID=1448316 RepID=A0A395GVY4_9EURO|nr:hypothetical protein BO80DRAFT_426275 [Aspergillus ibericus CBS 121593]RAK99572.1 hypothetical protein BO80DRAFT_426275 [Aspergillus ibericus CBS 121593]